MQRRCHVLLLRRTPRIADLSPLLLGLLALSFFPLGSANPAQAAETGRVYPNTGYSVKGAFLRYFDANGGVWILGYPISGELAENGRTVQYFERQRLEYVREFAGTPYEVQGARLGAEFVRGKRIWKVAQFTSKHNLLYVRETGHSLSNAFLEFWKANGGVRVFGYPISEPMQENGRTVQYFERARMEWHPDKAARGQAVQLGLLGKEYLATHPDTAARVAASQRATPASPGAVVISRPNEGSVAPAAGLNSQESELLRLIHEARQKAGLRPLAGNDRLRQIALSRSQDMATRNYFSHTTPEGISFTAMLNGQVSYAYTGEIIANNNYGEGETGRQAFNSYMNSPQHRTLILEPRFTAVGVGQARNNKGFSFFTVIFIQE